MEWEFGPQCGLCSYFVLFGRQSQAPKLSTVLHRISAEPMTIKFSDFQQITRSRTMSQALSGPDEMALLAKQLVETACPFSKPVRLLGDTLEFG
jgi:hypothetical protein